MAVTCKMRTPATPAIDNGIYDRLADGWWHDHGFLNLLRSTLNPWRVPYFTRALKAAGIDPRVSRALDVGCGGGLLAEEIAAMGFRVVGIDPSARSLDVARAHAAERRLPIEYQLGRGDDLPFGAATFDAVFCCDVLEHIAQWDVAVAEMARVLRSGGVLLYDTINRTFASKIRSIKIAQDWKWTRYAPPNTHVWEMFITPGELVASFGRHGLTSRGMSGTAPKGNPIRALRLTRQFRSGRISSAEFGRLMEMTEGPVLSGSYMGYAVKS